MSTLMLIYIDDAVVFPTMTATLPVDVGAEKRVVLLPRHEDKVARVGVVAEVEKVLRLPGGVRGAAVTGRQRATVGAPETDASGVLRASVSEHFEHVPPAALTRHLEHEYRAIVMEKLELRGEDGRVAEFLRSITHPGVLADTSGYSPDLTLEQKVQLLETTDVIERLELAIQLQREALAETQARKRIHEDVESGAQKQQREQYLRRQLDAIRRELGEDEATATDDYRTRIEAPGLPDAVREQAVRELGRLERAGDSSGESPMIRNYLDWLLAVPWGKRTEERIDPAQARAVLDADHAGLGDVKERVVEYLAVHKLRKERGIADDRRSGAILCFIGPPGTGKTSIGESIARSTGRKFVRMSLGGVRDEAEIRGHRRTYIGALPGRLVRALRDAGSMNPVIMLDEIDKIGADWRGDPSAALLEVLDPAQNHAFRDHYLDIELDLSEVLFITTGNVTDAIPSPLLDRMEVIRFDGYTTREKLEIARGFLWPKQIAANGLREDEVVIEDDALVTIIDEYTREAGVRQIERELGTLLRKIATRVASGQATPPVSVDRGLIREALGRQKVFRETAARTAVPGVATALAVTGAGGEALFVEATAVAGGTGLELTGQLGDVMKESARIALSFVRAHVESLGIDPSVFEEKGFHIHVPAGAIPKDGPSAGVAMVIALASLLSKRTVRHTVGVTGEITLRGRVLAVGGIKQKVLAAHAAGLTEVVLPERSMADLDDVPADVREALAFHPVDSVQRAIEIALEPPRGRELRAAVR